MGSPLLRNVMTLLVLAVTACGPASPAPSGASATPSASPRASPPPSSTPVPATPAPSIAAEPPPLVLELVADGTAGPVSIAADASGRLFVNERAGRVVAIEPGGELSVVVDLTDRVGADATERGLLGFALHPGWPGVGRAFVHYTDLAGDTVVSELSSTDGTSLDPASERMVLTLDQPYANHNGGQLSFGPDGYLYLGLGDGGSGGDPHGHGQDPGTLLGSILRIDVSGTDGYAIPADNPFAAGGGAPEVWVYGLRNPWRFSFDRATGDLWIGDVGQGAWEEIDRLPAGTAAGTNLGWNLMEGAHCFRSEGCDPAGLVLPVAEYGRDLGQAVSGGFVYRGSAIPGLGGWYLFADYGTGLLFGVPSDAAPPAGGSLTPRVLLQTGLAVSAFGEDASGELYLADLEGGGIYRIVGG